MFHCDHQPKPHKYISKRTPCYRKDSPRILPRSPNTQTPKRYNIPKPRKALFARSTTHNLQRSIRLHRRRRAPDRAARHHAVEREPVELVLQRQAAALLREDLDVAPGGAGLGVRGHGGGECAAEGDVDDDALVFGHVDDFGGARAAVFGRGGIGGGAGVWARVDCYLGGCRAAGGFGSFLYCWDSEGSADESCGGDEEVGELHFGEVLTSVWFRWRKMVRTCDGEFDSQDV
ncbi:hypothetical protein C7974DRAFT_399032 [Boeremia exigua]|uniref:uncharacterized protein n=1 Tax=Boeremia exigua TaxID=749465 RepID=UPI001E8CEE99|nr:uncharacterized protein C7974DRAFT_399032 [Boeremia exigua]KAH6620164.1 hypothetical protein C7974DRAFT_399032 [Boeremia exigua]